jgi:hypothetical protein
MKFIKNVVKTGFRSTYDFFHKLGDCFDPKLYSKKYRVSQTINGNSTHNGPTVAIFVLYQKGRIPFYVKNVLNTLNALHVDVVVTVNDDIGQDQIDWLIQNCSLCILRKNFGRDFGAYKDAIELVNLEKYQKLLLVNDSLFYFSKGLDLVCKNFINSEKDLVVLTENFDKSWHAQTHFMSLSKNVFLSKRFIKFWDEYRPYNSRPHSIFNGEIKFSQDVLRYFATGREVYYGAGLATEFFAASNSSVIEEINLILNLFADIDDDRGGVIRLMKQMLRHQSSADPQTLLSLQRDAINSVVSQVQNKNLSHSLAFLSPYLTGSCIIKRDLVYRESFSLNQVGVALRFIGIDDLEIKLTLNEIMVKGIVSKLPLYSRIKANYGLL